jgi:hypothetical protein
MHAANTTLTAPYADLAGLYLDQDGYFSISAAISEVQRPE